MTPSDEDHEAARREEATRTEMGRLRQRIAELEQSNAYLQHQLGEQTRELSFFKALVENAPDAIATAHLDEGGGIAYLNPAGQVLIGDAPFSQGMAMLGLHPTDPERSFAEATRHMVDRGTWQGVVTCRREDGSTFEGQASGFVIRDPAGQPQALAGIIRDVTEHKRTEAALREAHEALEMRVQERTAALSRMNQELLQENAERQRAERALHESESKFRQFFEQSWDGLVLCDNQGTVIEWNRGKERIWGMKREAVLGRPIWEVIFEVTPDEHQTPEVLARIKTTTLEMLQQGNNLSPGQWMVREIQRPDGTRRTVHSLVFPIQTEQGLLVGSITRDITDRERAEQALRRHDAILEALGFAAERFLQTTTLHENISAVLERLGVAAGVSRVYMFENHRGPHGEWLMSQRYEWVAAGTVPQMDNPELQNLPYQAGGFARWESAMQKGYPIYGEVNTFPPEERDILEPQDIQSIAVVPIFACQQWWGFIGFDDCQHTHPWSVSEISILRAAATIIGAAIEHEHMQRALRESEQKFRWFFEQSHDSLVLVNEQGRIIEWNQGSEHIIGRPRSEAVGQFIWDMQFQMVPREHQTTELYERLRTMTLEMHRSGRMPSLNHWVGHDIQRPDGTQRTIYSLVFPIQTDRGTWLGGITRDLTALKQAEENLHRAREEAETAARTKSEFLANMSHEIRTPMNAVIGMTSLLLDTSLTNEQRDYVQTIRISGESLLTLINDILDFSKIEAGKMDLEDQPFNLRDCIEESLDLVAPKAAEKRLDVAYLIEDSTPTDLIGDITRVRQILVNLLSNAVKFTEQGEVVVTVGGRELGIGDGGYEVHITVRDTGIGIPADRLGRLFQSFSQVDTSMTRKYGGTGLGLVISKRLAEMMGGAIWAESEEGQGSTFHVTFVARAAPSQPRPYLDPDQPVLQGKRVLVVDDNQTNRFILRHQLARWGMETRATPSAAEALEWIRQGIPFDIAILDMHMPEMDGLDLAERIRTERDAYALPLVLWTSILGRSDIDRTSSVEIAATLTKPVRPSTLYDMLVGFFEGKPREIILPTVWGDIDRHMGQHHPLRILLAEDNTINQKVALRLLEKLGYHADVASNGLEVLHALKQLPYDVVLMDIQMPEMDGIEATRAIRTDWKPHRQPHIVAMTAHAMEGVRESLLQAGMDDYVRKPIKLEELVGALQRVEPSAAPAPSSALASVPSHSEPAAPAASGDPVPPEPVDFRVLEHLKTVMGSAEVFQELIGLYLEDTPELLASLRQALERGDIQVFVRAAHSLKSSSAQVGAMRLSDLSERLELFGRDESLRRPEEAAKLIALVANEFERVQNVLTGRYRE